MVCPVPQLEGTISNCGLLRRENCIPLDFRIRVQTCMSSSTSSGSISLLFQFDTNLGFAIGICP
jgi:hypothetical protein